MIYRMSFASEPPIKSPQASDAGSGDVCGLSLGRPGESSVAALDPFLYQEMHRCLNCGGDQIFLALYELWFSRNRNTASPAIVAAVVASANSARWRWICFVPDLPLIRVWNGSVLVRRSNGLKVNRPVG